MPRIAALFFCVLLAGCATAPKPLGTGKSPETIDEQLEAAQKVVGGMANKDMSREDLIKFGQNLKKDPEAQIAVQKITAPAAPVIKYSPVTGKHYSGDVDIDPETGVKLQILP